MNENGGTILEPFSEHARIPLRALARKLPACLANRMIYEVRGLNDSQIDLSIHVGSDAFRLALEDASCGSLTRALMQSRDS